MLMVSDDGDDVCRYCCSSSDGVVDAALERGREKKSSSSVSALAAAAATITMTANYYCSYDSLQVIMKLQVTKTTWLATSWQYNFNFRWFLQQKSNLYETCRVICTCTCSHFRVRGSSRAQYTGCDGDRRQWLPGCWLSVDVVPACTVHCSHQAC